jgi:hypothetical protein
MSALNTALALDAKPCAECGRPVTYDRTAEWYRHTEAGQPACALALEGPTAPIDYVLFLPWTNRMTRAQCKAGLGMLRAVAGGGFHPDDGVDDLWMPNGVRLFSPREASRLNEFIGWICDAGFDPCELMLELDSEARAAGVAAEYAPTRERSGQPLQQWVEGCLDDIADRYPDLSDATMAQVRALLTEATA